jgi:hypothetical protein
MGIEFQITQVCEAQSIELLLFIGYTNNDTEDASNRTGISSSTNAALQNVGLIKQRLHILLVPTGCRLQSCRHGHAHRSVQNTWGTYSSG